MDSMSEVSIMDSMSEVDIMDFMFEVHVGVMCSFVKSVLWTLYL